MRYKSFRIQNFKGIQDTTVNLDCVAGASVFALVGLNESGKTTVLEAIHSFAPDSATAELLGGGKGVGVPIEKRVPRHKISNFSGVVSVTATISVSEEDRDRIIENLKSKHKIDINPEDFPTDLIISSQQKFSSGDFQSSYYKIDNQFPVKSGSSRKLNQFNADQEKLIVQIIWNYIPKICYFPTFIFEFPSRIYLSDRGSRIDAFYRRVFQDILDYDGQGHTITQNIVGRLRQEKYITPWAEFSRIWNNGEDKNKVQQVIDRASDVVTRIIIGNWSKVFNETPADKSVNIVMITEPGESSDDSGNNINSDSHDVIIRFEIKDGTNRFPINERSLGFRWFFSFMLFTQFRIARNTSVPAPILFLFDEPASNLHAAAQQKLIESFPNIAKNNNVLIYSTHSHHMIEPKWLEQTFIITNSTDFPDSDIINGVSFSDESLDVKVETYRSFVNRYPTQSSYFQPILDRLDVIPSKFDIDRKSIILEGKSDYYILRYSGVLHGVTDLHYIPAFGASTFGPLMSLNVGWNLNSLFLLDADKAGDDAKKRYHDLYGANIKNLYQLKDFRKDLSEIEDLLDNEALTIIKNTIKSDKSPTKGQISRFFQEQLASDNVINLGSSFSKKSLSLLTELKCKLTEISGG